MIQSILFSDNEMLPPNKDSDLHFVVFIILLVQTSTGHLVARQASSMESFKPMFALPLKHGTIVRGFTF